MSHQAGVWEYDPSSDHLAWSFPEGVALEDLAHDELAHLLSALRRAADLSGPGSVVEELRIGDPEGKKDQWIAIYGRRILGVKESPKVVGVVLDVSDSKSQVQASQLVISELEHRMRNTAAVAQSLAMSILRSSDSLAKAQETLSSRFDAMNQSGASLDEQRWRRTTVPTVLRLTLEGLGIEGRCELRGPPAEVTASVARALSMVVHELATNAMKHGALSNERGRVRISWRRLEDRHAALVEWREVGGVIGRTSPHEGYGSTLINTALRSENTQVAYTFGKTGLTCTLVGVPLCEC